MKSVYRDTWLHNLTLIKEAKDWMKHDLIGQEQFRAIKTAYPSEFYHPNLMIRILLFIATLIALSGATGTLGLLVVDGGQFVISLLCLLYGIGSFIVLEKVLIENMKHYKSGVTEALLYHSIGWTIGGVAGLTDFQVHAVILTCILVFSFAAFRYLDLISTFCALGSFAYLIFYTMYEAGGILQFVIPFAFLLAFTPLYFLVNKIKKSRGTDPWLYCLTLVEALCLLLIYAAGNYLVVRELSVSLMNLYLEEGQDIPYAFIFYGLTVIIPIAYLYFGIKNKDAVVLRVSLVAIAFSVFTFKYYFSLGHPEITLTVSGALLLIISLYLFRYLKIPRGGYTRENILSDKWSNINAEAFVMSQTLGGNKVVTDDRDLGGGGSFSGGGSSDSF